ncbi:MAG: hypothetical protein QM485_08915 [Flavobacteriaceae bacterium]
MKKEPKVIDLFGGIIEAGEDNDDIYSRILTKFVAPFIKRFPRDFAIEDVYQFGMNAWNLALMKEMLPKEEWQHIDSGSFLSDSEKTIMKQMIRAKEQKFVQYNRFISDLFLKEDEKGEIIPTVVTEDKEDFLSEMMAQSDEDFSEDDFDEEYNNFEEGYIDRFAIVVRPQKPFFDWLNAIYTDSPVFEANEVNTYLVDEIEEEIEFWLKKNYDTIFTKELFGWHTGERDWPKKRTYGLFKKWFQIDVSTMVYDLVDHPIYKEL